MIEFGLKESVVVSSDETTELTYSQKETPLIRNIKHLQNIILLVLSIVGIFMMIFPIFNYNNVWAFIGKMQESGYKFEVLESLKINKYTTFFRLISNVSSYLSVEDKILNPTLVLFLYELSVLIIIFAIIASTASAAPK